MSLFIPDSEVSFWVKNAPEENAATFMAFIFVTVMIYDILLTLDDEKEYVWSFKWSSIKFLFLIVRYFPLSILLFEVITLIFPSKFTCSTLEWYGSIGAIFVMAAADLFLAYRVYAFCGENKYLLSFLIITFFGWEAIAFSFTAVFLPRGVTTFSPGFHLNVFLRPICAPKLYPQNATIIWIGMLCYQSILFLCFILSALYKHGIFYCGWFLRSKQAPLYRVFMRDGLWAYFVIVVSLALNVAAALKWRDLGSSFVALFTVVSSICTCRLIFNIRSVAYKPMSISM